ncbi:ATP-binding protein [Streptomyces sp. C10-9-1]|uniref:ATP-binding protein n=1 Tax=Streptomyces sp. C10-9-1 TaxID=1859285 RepID=UPI0021130B80|nr:ATP-binding protein [Streptomyces sp. C10-9-1]MCQ6555006.1 ATP-binding protein [Streptomyces sp. C10-9-1]
MIVMTGFRVPQPTDDTSVPAHTPEESQASRYPDVVHQDEHALPHHPTSAGTARRHARQVLASWGIQEDEVFDALLVVSELVTNAVEHALPPVALHLKTTSEADGSTRLHIDVIDGGPAPQDGTWTSSCSADEHGRGQQIVAALAEDTTAGPCHSGTDHGATLPANRSEERRQPGTWQQPTRNTVPDRAAA